MLIVLVLIVYGNTFKASWHLDDRTNILGNKHVQVSSLSLTEWVRSMAPPFSDPSKATSPLSQLYRPVAMFSFAVNWFLGGTDVVGYHVVNIGLHCAAALLLCYTCINLLGTPNLHDRYKKHAFPIAFLAATLWALHPIQTQAVTYIVQRMAVLAGLFYLAGIFFYIKGRDAQPLGKKIMFFSLGVVSYGLAVGSKQNAVTLPLAWLLVEIVFYRPAGFWKQRHVKWIGLGMIAGLFVFFGLVLFFWQADPLSTIMQGYRLRSFTLCQRLLTEARVLVFHLGQLIYPIPQQFSITHDFNISTSLYTPWTTLGALILIGSIVGGALFCLRRLPLLSFAVIFFFLGHSVESTILPLELIFEHRNYLPSFFVFLPLADGIVFLVNKYKKTSKLLYFLLISFVCLIVLGVGAGAHIRNSVWRYEKSLWQDALKKAPLLARPHLNLAGVLEREGKLDAALRLYQKALELEDPEPELSRFISLSNIGNIYRKKADYPRAIQYLTRAVVDEKGPYKQRVRLNLALCLLNAGRMDEAMQPVEIGLRQHRQDIRFLTVKGFILTRQGETEKALTLFQKVLKQRPYDRDGLINLAMAISSMGYYQRSEWFLKRAQQRYPGDLIIHLGLLQNAVASGDHPRVEQYTSDIARIFSMEDIAKYLAAREKGHLYIRDTLVPIDDALVFPVVIDYIKKKVLE